LNGKWLAGWWWLLRLVVKAPSWVKRGLGELRLYGSLGL
jgi:hypothetical protein